MHSPTCDSFSDFPRERNCPLCADHLSLPDKIFESCLNGGPEDGEYFLVQGERIQLMDTWHETFRGIFVVFHSHLKILNSLYCINLLQTSLYGFYKVIVQFNITLGHKLAEFHVVTS